MKALLCSLILLHFLFTSSCFAAENVTVFHGCLMTYIFLFVVGLLVLTQLMAAIVYLVNAVKNNYYTSHQPENNKEVNRLKLVA